MKPHTDESISAKWYKITVQFRKTLFQRKVVDRVNETRHVKKSVFRKSLALSKGSLWSWDSYLCIY